MQRGILAGGAFVIAAGATVWGTFEKIMTSELTTLDPTGSREIPVYSYDATWWALNQTTPLSAGPGQYAPFGVIPALAAGMIMVAAVLTTNLQLLTGARVSAALGIGVLAGAVGIRLMDALDGLSREPAPGQSTRFVIGLGIWLPAGAIVLGLAGLVLILINKREPATPAAPDR